MAKVQEPRGRTYTLARGKSRDKVITLPEFAILATYKLPRHLDSLFVVRAFEAFYGRKVSIIPKSIDTILMHGFYSASRETEGGLGIIPSRFS